MSAGRNAREQVASQSDDAAPNSTGPALLDKSIGAAQFFTISFSTIVGVGWMIVLGDWLRQAGPVGAIIALLAAGAVMMLVGLCYAEISTAFPVSGGEMAYAYEVFGLRTSFVTGWFLALIWISATSFEALSAGWIAGILFPALASRPIYVVRGTPVFLGTLLFGLAGTLLLTALNNRGMRASARFQSAVTWTKIAISMLLAMAGMLWGKVRNLDPIIAAAHGASRWSGILSVFVTAPFWYAGFNSVAQLIEEKKPTTSYGWVAFSLLASIGGAAIFYALLILACGMAVPWPQIVGLDFPAAGAFKAALHSEFGAKFVLLSGLIGLLATWNACFVAASRVLFALGRAHMIDQRFGRVHCSHHTPTNAVTFVAAVSSVGIFLGRGVIAPIVSMDSTCFVFLYVGISVTMLRLRMGHDDASFPYRVPNGYLIAWLSLITTGFMLLESLYLPFANGAWKFPAEWIVFIAWGLLGRLFWSLSKSSREDLTDFDRRRLILGSEVGEEF
ncbi:MAG TPA: APC family permease [Candidatus Sulfotelmatobacter sp.]|nr:APC family permease [Candidatus Sulfotelmatobacter sp.]